MIDDPRQLDLFGASEAPRQPSAPARPTAPKKAAAKKAAPKKPTAKEAATKKAAPKKRAAKKPAPKKPVDPRLRDVRDEDRDGPLRLVVLGDSTCFIDATGPQLPGHPGVWPTMLAADLTQRLGIEVEVTVVARPGMTVVDAWSIVAKDQHVQFDLLMGADAVVLSVGSFDHAPFGIPLAVNAVVPHLRPAFVRRKVRQALHATYPLVVKVTAGRFTRTPTSTFDQLYDQLLTSVRGLANQAAMAAVGPTSHRSEYYGAGHPRHADRQARQGELAAKQGVAYVPSWPLVEPHADDLNVDGIHWPLAAHEAVATALAPVLQAQLTGQSTRPGMPKTVDDA